MNDTMMYEGMLGMLGAFLGIYLFVILAMAIITIISMWKIFGKAGKPGWASLIPFYNAYVLAEITWGNGWYFLLGLIPLGNLVFLVMSALKLAKAYGKPAVFGVGLVLLSVVFYPILAFGKSEYEGTDDTWLKGTVIGCAVAGGIWLFMLIFA